MSYLRDQVKASDSAFVDPLLADPLAEQCLLGAIVLDNDTWGEVQDIFVPAMFYVPEHRFIAEAIVALAAQGSGLEMMTVRAWLISKGHPEAGDMVLSLGRSFGTSSGARHYATIIRSVWVRRRVRDLAEKVIEGDVEDPLALVLEEVSKLETGTVGKVRSLDDVLYDRIQVLEEQRKAGPNAKSDSIPTGFQKLDWLIGGLRPGLPVLIAARPSVGKSALTSALLDNLSSQGHVCGVFHLEDEASSLADRAITRRAKVTSTLLRNGADLTKEHWERICTMKSGHPIWIDDDKGLSAKDIVVRMRRMKKERGCTIFFVDHLGEVELEFLGKQDRHDLALGRALKLLRKAAHDLKVCLVVMHQMSRDVERRADPTPRLSDLRDSGDLEAIARVIIFLSRPEEMPGKFVLDVAKNTNGPTGRCVLSWLEDYMAVVEPPPVA